MKKIFMFLLLALAMSHDAVAQMNLRITTTDGNFQDFRTENIADMGFIYEEPINIVGEWFNYDTSGGVYESWNLFANGTMEYSFCFYNLDKEITTFRGSYTFSDDNVLTLNVAGTKMALNMARVSETECSATSSTNSFSCYKVIDTPSVEENQYVELGEEGDEIIYADNNVVALEDGKIKGLRKGFGYALVKSHKTQEIAAYKILVTEGTSDLVNFTKYFKWTPEQLVEEFGEPLSIMGDDDYKAYIYGGIYGFVKSAMFTVEDGKVFSVGITFFDFESMQPYVQEIEEKYELNEERSTGVEKIYYEKGLDYYWMSNIAITVMLNTNTIMWGDLSL